MKSAKFLREEAARQGWRLAGQRFAGLSPLLKAQVDLQNIRRSGSGYEVVITRCLSKFCHYIPGSGEESLKAAMVLRDELLRAAPPKRKNAIPPAVLRKLGLSKPVIGISRLGSRSCYRVHWADATGRGRLKTFYFRSIPEADAYAAAILFREELDRVRWLQHANAGEASGWDESRGSVSLLGARRFTPLPADAPL